MSVTDQEAARIVANEIHAAVARLNMALSRAYDLDLRVDVNTATAATFGKEHSLTVVSAAVLQEIK